MNGKTFTKEEEVEVIRDICQSDPTNALRRLCELMPERESITIRNKAKKMGFIITFGERKSVTPEELASLRKLSAEGGTWPEAFALMPGRSPNVIRKICFRRGIKFAKRMTYFASREELQHLIDCGHSSKSIAELYNLPYKHVSYVLHAYHIDHPRVRTSEVKTIANVKKKDIIAELQAREAELEAMLPASVANGTTAEILSKLNAVRLKIHHQQKKSDYIVNTL